MSVATFAGGTLDRMGSRRADAAWVAAQQADSSARAVLAGSRGVVVDGDRPALVPLAGLAGRAGVEPILLGVDASGPLFAVDLDDLVPDAAPAGDGRYAWGPRATTPGAPGTPLRAGAVPGLLPAADLCGLRDVAPRLPAADAGLLAYAAALLHWRRTSRFCGRCGAATEPAEGGTLRRCPRCGLHLHPRTDPVVIMLVTDGDRVLLGRQPRWPPGRFSALAGFVEPGESLEAAVAREVLEEAGVEVGDVRYVGSQPWPFPASLMLGFEAAWHAGVPRVADAELEDVRWVDADELHAGRRDGAALRLPPPEAIARRLVDAWLARRGR